MVRKWSTRYARTSGGYEAQCPYCGARATYPTLSEAVDDALIHAEVCGGPIHPA